MSNANLSCWHCRQPILQNSKMLSCRNCNRLFHDKCLACLDFPILIGDSFYVLICSVCNAGSEYLARLELNWTELLHVCLYHLTVESRNKYFDLDDTILPFLVTHWKELHVYGITLSKQKPEQHSMIKNVLLSNFSKFKCAKEIKKRQNMFALRKKVPPKVVGVVTTPGPVLRGTLSWNTEVSDGRGLHVLYRKEFKPKKALRCQSTSTSAKEVKPVFKAGADASKCLNSASINGTNSPKPSSSSLLPAEAIVFNSLDDLIPLPINFIGENNPFWEPSKGHKSTNGRARKTNGTESGVVPLSMTANHREKRFGVWLVTGRRVLECGKVQHLLEKHMKY